jgi:tetratricopeptide (TPR) repeat protein
MQQAAQLALEGARLARSNKDLARKAVAEALRLAPDDIDVRMAAYKFHFYNQEYEPAAVHAAVCIATFAADLGLSADWRAVGPADSDFGALDQKPGRFVQALIAWGYCSARAGALAEGRAAIAKAAELDPADRFGAKRLLAVVDRGGVEEDFYAPTP